jgi:hypothetical protein
MSTEEDKFKHSKRLQKEENAVKKQTKIAKAHGLTDKDKAIKEPHRLAKHHAMDCGQPGCVMCGNPRKTHKTKEVYSYDSGKGEHHQQSHQSFGKTDIDGYSNALIAMAFNRLTLNTHYAILTVWQIKKHSKTTCPKVKSKG